MLAFLKKLLFALVLFAVVLFLYQNRAALSTNVPFKFDLLVAGYQYQTPEIPVWILFGVFFLLGMLTAGFHGVYERLARGIEIRKRDKRIRSLEKEIDGLKTQVAELRPPEAAEVPRPAAGEGDRRVIAAPRAEPPSPPKPPEDEEPTL